MMERVLTDEALRDRLVAEASEHVLRFDWADVAQQTRARLRAAGRRARGRRARLRAARQPASRSMPSATVRRTTARLSRLRSNSRGV